MTAKHSARLASAGQFAGHALLVGAAMLAVGALLWRLRMVTIPLLAALLLTTVLSPLTDRLRRRGHSSTRAATVVFGGAAVVFTAMGWLILPPFVDQLDDLASAAADAVDDVQSWLSDGPLHLDDRDVDAAVGGAAEAIRGNQGELAAGALAGVTMAGEALIGGILCIVSLFFFLKDGPRIIDAVLRVAEQSKRERVQQLGRRVWRVLSGYVRGVAVDGVVEGVVIGVGLALLGVPLALPLAIVTFLGGFVPVVGALAAGALAAAVALVAVGPTTALAVIVLVLVVQNVVTNLIDPLVMSRTVKIHPVVVLTAVISGGVLGGVLGAFVAVPVTATALEVAAFLRDGD